MPFSPSHPRYVTACPVGCIASLEPTENLQPEGPLLRCAGCGQLLSQASEAQYQAALRKWDTRSGTLPDARSVERHRELSGWRIATLLRLLGTKPGATRLLDVGCSSGAFLAAAAAAGLRAEGVEPSPEAAEGARRAGFKVFTGMLEDACYPDGSFDAVTLVEVLEHLREPLPLLAECRRVLRPGGIVMATTPNAASWTARCMGSRWEVFSLTAMGGHVSFFSPASLGLLAQRAGFELARIETRHVRLAEKGQFPTPVYLLAKLVSGLLDVPSRLARAGHAITVYFRKPHD
ncbi:MAG TPA: class I SAM-dependent methyltransferase [Burkholderiales bacterium]